MEKLYDWEFTFQRIVGLMSSECYKLMVGAEKVMDEYEEKPLNDGEEKVSGELHDILCQVCTSDPLGVVKAVNDMQGVAAWQKNVQEI